MTASELREMAKQIEGVVGASGMNKAELIATIKEAKGIVDEETSRRKSVDVREVKKKISELKEKRDKAREEGNAKMVDAFRRRISNLKKKTRRA
jgi:cysteinyl-tRNA synthetase